MGPTGPRIRALLFGRRVVPTPTSLDLLGVKVRLNSQALPEEIVVLILVERDGDRLPRTAQLRIFGPGDVLVFTSPTAPVPGILDMEFVSITIATRYLSAGIGRYVCSAQLDSGVPTLETLHLD